MLLPVILTTVVAITALAYVALPLLRAADPRGIANPNALVSKRLELVEERDRALAALKELEFDHRTGKVSDSDYRELVGPLRQRAVEALRSLKPAEVPTPSTSPGRRRKHCKATERV